MLHIDQCQSGLTFCLLKRAWPREPDMSDDIVTFLRQRDYRLEKELGQGACGKTVLLYDDLIDEWFVCKKFAPTVEASRQQLFASFMREVKLMHALNHENVVRVFNYYLYPEQLAGFILMEYVEGLDIQDFLADSPEMANELFTQAIAGFRHLEARGVLHRDIRPQNVLVRSDGTLKIIDFGFGKQVEDLGDFDKSVSLNWWCDPPSEFPETYDFKTEVYFLGKLFERIIQENGIDHFKYMAVLGKMCEWSADSRSSGFAAIEKAIESDRFFEIGFNEDEVESYRNFADAVASSLSKVGSKAKYQDDVERVQSQLESAYRGFMLEATVPDASAVLACLLDGPYFFRKRSIQVGTVRDFLHLMKSCSTEKRRIVIANLQTRLDALPRYDEDDTDDDIPF